MDHSYPTNSPYDSDNDNPGNECNVTTDTIQQSDHELLINCIRGYPNIWDKGHDLYKDSVARASSWGDIAKCLDKKVEDLQKCWNSLRKKFMNERSARDKENLSGSAASSRPKWHLYDSMLFLEKTISRRRTRTNFTPQSGQLKENNIADTIDFPSPLQSTVAGQLKENNIADTIDFPSPLQSTVAGQLSESLKQRSPLAPLQISNQYENFEYSVLASTSTKQSSSTDQNLSPTSPISLSRPSRPASASSTDSTDTELYVSAQSFKQPLMFKTTLKNKRNTSSQRDEMIDKSIETVSTSITALSNHLIHGKSSEECRVHNDDEEVLIGRLVTNKLKKLSGEEKKEAIKKIYSILLS